MSNQTSLVLRSKQIGRNSKDPNDAFEEIQTRAQEQQKISPAEPVDNIGNDSYHPDKMALERYVPPLELESAVVGPVKFVTPQQTMWREILAGIRALEESNRALEESRRRTHECMMEGFQEINDSLTSISCGIGRIEDKLASINYGIEEGCRDGREVRNLRPEITGLASKTGCEGLNSLDGDEGKLADCQLCGERFREDDQEYGNCEYHDGTKSFRIPWLDANCFKASSIYVTTVH